jgi:hypothetical protein
MQEVTKRLESAGVTKLYIPQLTTTKPVESNPQLGDKCIPILVTDPKILKTKQRVVVIIPQSDAELECFHWGGMFHESGLEESSPLAYAKDLANEADSPGLIVANCQQLLFSFKCNKALSEDGWSYRERRSMIHPTHQVLEENKLRAHTTPEEHIKWVFDEFLWNKDFISPTAKFDILANRQAGERVLAYLDKKCEFSCSQS